MFTEHERRILEKIRMTDIQAENTWEKILQASGRKKYSITVPAVCIACILMLALALPPVRTYAEELWKNSWFYSDKQAGQSKKNQEKGDWIVFPDTAPLQDKTYSSLTEISELLKLPLLRCDDPVFDEVYYKPSLNQSGQLISLQLWGHNRQASQTFISKEELYAKFTDNLTEAQRADIERIYGMKDEDIASYYSAGLSYSAVMYGKESGVTGDIRTLAPTRNSITYASENLHCDVLIEKQKRMDGTYMTYATWISDDILYTLIGYRSADEMKAAVERMYY